MRKIVLALVPALALGGASAALAQGAATGAAGGAVTGAIIGGPVGAAVGGVVGAVAGTALAPPPAEVRAYVVKQKQPSIAYSGEVIVGRPLPQSVVLYPVPDAPTYSYAYVNNHYVIVDPKTHIIVSVEGG
jgi:hypothetical protein